MAKLEEIARTISLFARPDMKPKQLMALVREHHPDASKKDVSRGAFYAVILAAEKDPQKVAALHDIAMASRATDTTEGLLIGEPAKSKRAKKTKH